MFIWTRKVRVNHSPEQMRKALSIGTQNVMVRHGDWFANEQEAINYSQTYLKSNTIGHKLAVQYKEGDAVVWLIMWSENLKYPESYAEVIAINADTANKKYHRFYCGKCQKPVSSGFEDQIFTCCVIMCFDCVNESSDPGREAK